MKTNVALSELQHRFGPGGFDSVNPPSLLRLVGMPSVEHNAVAGLERPVQFQNTFLPLNSADLAQENAALFPEAGMDQLLIVGASQPAGGKAARESHLHLILCLRRGFFSEGSDLWGRVSKFSRRYIQGLPVNARDIGHVFG